MDGDVEQVERESSTFIHGTAWRRQARDKSSFEAMLTTAFRIDRNIVWEEEMHGGP